MAQSQGADTQTVLTPQAISPGLALPEMVRLMEDCSDGLIQADEHGVITYANTAVRTALGLPADLSSAAWHWPSWQDPLTSLRLRRGALVALGRTGRWQVDTLLQGQTGTVSFTLLIVAHPDAAGHVSRYSALLRRRTDERQAQQLLRRQADILHAITEAIPATVVVVDGDGIYRFANQAFERYCGLTREQIIGRRAIDVLGPNEVARRKPYMVRAFNGESVEFVLDYPSDKGTQWLSLSCIPLKVDGVLDGFVGISQDVTREHRERDRLAHIAERDPLTGLLNRGGFERCIERLMADDRATALTLFYVDVDHFKPVNDSHGHLAGDRLLQLFAQRLLKSVRTSDVVARLGGDEFAVVLAGTDDRDQALSVADKVLAAVREPFVLDHCTVHVTASIGVAVGLHPHAGWRELVGRADAMLYRAKAEGRGRAAG